MLQSPYLDVSHSWCTFPPHKRRSSIAPGAVLNHATRPTRRGSKRSRFLFLLTKCSPLYTTVVQPLSSDSLHAGGCVLFPYANSLGPHNRLHIKGHKLHPQKGLQLKVTNAYQQASLAVKYRRVWFKVYINLKFYFLV